MRLRPSVMSRAILRRPPSSRGKRIHPEVTCPGMSDTQAIDAVVIGAGIAGTSVAYFLSNHAKVVVLERESQAGLHSTGRSAALFSETYGSSQVRTLTRASRSFFERPPRGFVENPLLTPRGALVIGTQEQSAQVESDCEAMRVFTPQLQLLDAVRMRSLVPVLEPQFAQAGFVRTRRGGHRRQRTAPGFHSRPEAKRQPPGVRRTDSFHRTLGRRVASRGRHARRATAYPARTTAHRRRGRLGR